MSKFCDTIPSTIDCIDCEQEFDTDGIIVKVEQIKMEFNDVVFENMPEKWLAVVCPHCGHKLMVKPV